MRWFLAIALVAGGCAFKVGSVNGGDDLGDNGGEDLAMGGDDLSPNGSDDMAMGGPADMVTPIDLMPPPLMVSHVGQHYLTDGACDLVVTASINTSTRKVDVNDVPAGCVFMNDSESGGLNVAVLAANSVTFNGTVTVSGSVPLVVYSHTTIAVNGVLDGSATGFIASASGST